MTDTERMLNDAVYTLNNSWPADELTAALRDVLYAALQWFDNWEDWTLPSGTPASPERNFRVAPEGRAAIRLAEAILAGDE